MQRLRRLKGLGLELANGADARWRPGLKARLRAEANMQVALENITSDLAIRHGRRQNLPFRGLREKTAGL